MLQSNKRFSLLRQNNFLLFRLSKKKKRVQGPKLKIQRKPAWRVSAISEFADSKTLMDYMLEFGYKSITMGSQKGSLSNPGQTDCMTNLIDVSTVCIAGDDWPKARKFCRSTLRTSSKQILSLAHYLEAPEIREAAMKLLSKKKLANLANNFPKYQFGSQENILHTMQKEIHKQNRILANLELTTIIKKHHVRLLELQVQEDLQLVYYQHIYDCKKRGAFMRIINKIEKSVDPDIDDNLLNLMYDWTTTLSPQ